MSTDGDISEATSPLGLEEQPWENFQEKQDLSAAIEECGIRGGDKLEFQNCKKCGSLVFENVSFLKISKFLSFLRILL